MLKRREECDAYLTHVCRHHWSRKSPVKRLNIRSFQPKLWLSADESRSLFTFPGFPFVLTLMERYFELMEAFVSYKKSVTNMPCRLHCCS